MQAQSKRNIASGKGYDQYFPASAGRTSLVKDFGDTDFTIETIRRVASQTVSQTSKVAPLLRGADLNETCRNIWNFVYGHIQYVRDKFGVEEIRQPARTWRDRKGDCDDYTIFVSTILANLGIPHLMRVTAYKGDWQHIYVIVPLDGNTSKDHSQSRSGEYYVIDPVVDSYNYEVKYSKKQDFPMKIQELSGIGDIGKSRYAKLVNKGQAVRRDTGIYNGGQIYRPSTDRRPGKRPAGKLGRNQQNVGPKGMMAQKDFTRFGKPVTRIPQSTGGSLPPVTAEAQQLGALFNPQKKAARRQKRADKKEAKAAAGSQALYQPKPKKHFGKIVRGAATVQLAPLRGAWLAAMKLNIFKIASRLQYAYLPDSVAASNGIDASKLAKLRQLAAKKERMFIDIGGKAENFIYAIKQGAKKRPPAITEAEAMGSKGSGIGLDPATLTAVGAIMGSLVALSGEIRGALESVGGGGSYLDSYMTDEAYLYGVMGVPGFEFDEYSFVEGIGASAKKEARKAAKVEKKAAKQEAKQEKKAAKQETKAIKKATKAPLIAVANDKNIQKSVQVQQAIAKKIENGQPLTSNDKKALEVTSKILQKAEDKGKSIPAAAATLPAVIKQTASTHATPPPAPLTKREAKKEAKQDKKEAKQAVKVMKKEAKQELKAKVQAAKNSNLPKEVRKAAVKAAKAQIKETKQELKAEKKEIKQDARDAKREAKGKDPKVGIFQKMAQNKTARKDARVTAKAIAEEAGLSNKEKRDLKKDLKEANKAINKAKNEGDIVKANAIKEQTRRALEKIVPPKPVVVTKTPDGGTVVTDVIDTATDTVTDVTSIYDQIKSNSGYPDSIDINAGLDSDGYNVDPGSPYPSIPVYDTSGQQTPIYVEPTDYGTPSYTPDYMPTPPVQQMDPNYGPVAYEQIPADYLETDPYGEDQLTDEYADETVQPQQAGSPVFIVLGLLALAGGLYFVSGEEAKKANSSKKKTSALPEGSAKKKSETKASSKAKVAGNKSPKKQFSGVSFK